MGSIVRREDDEYVIDLKAFFQLLLRKLPIIVLAMAIGAALAVGFSMFKSTPMYEAEVGLLCSSKTEILENAQSDTVRKPAELVDACAAVIQSDVMLKQAIAKAGVDINPGELKGNLTIQDDDKTEFFTIKVVDPDPEMAVRLVNAVAAVAVEKISEIVEDASIKVLGFAETSDKIASNYGKWGAIGAFAGLFLSILIIFIIAWNDTGIKGEVDFEYNWDYPLLSSIPDGKAKDRDSSSTVQEAYKNLRTNLIFTLPESGCKVLVVTSGEQGEAGSATAIDLATSFAQNASKTLLVDCDLRSPIIPQDLGVSSKPGLSDVLTGVNRVSDTVISLPQGVDLIPAGELPQNPTELLGSKQMKVFLEGLNDSYEFVILNTPPINEMADGVILSKLAVGTVLVVRQGVATRESVDRAVKKLEFVKAPLLGFVFTDAKS